MTSRLPAVIALLLAAGLAPLAAQGPQAAEASALIGMDPPTLLATLGFPQQLLTQRGEAADQDNVVFFYPDCRSVFWYQNRVWQVRFDRRYIGTIMGYRIGMHRGVAEAVAPGRLEANGDSLYLTIDTLRFPMRLRLVLADGAVADMYLYRSDF